MTSGDTTWTCRSAPLIPSMLIAGLGETMTVALPGGGESLPRSPQSSLSWSPAWRMSR